ncbi:MAG: DUF3047 domain-containing protein [bacterium]
MKISKIFLIFTLLNLICPIEIALVFAQTISNKLLGEFENGWDKYWMERKISDKPTSYIVVQEDTNFVLMAKSDNSASGLWRMLSMHPAKRGKILWRWKVAKSLSKNTQEKNKIGDDYVARLFVVFEPHFINWKTRAICYVWAAKEPVGSNYKNPYSNSVGIIVVESGNKRTGKWITEKRDFIADYMKIFGKAPEMVSAVVIMVDTDNTGQKAMAWFDDIILELEEPEIELDEAIKGEIMYNL